MNIEARLNLLEDSVHGIDSTLSAQTSETSFGPVRHLIDNAQKVSNSKIYQQSPYIASLPDAVDKTGEKNV